jgi:hypothetical protein
MAKTAFDHMNWWGYDSESPFSHETEFDGSTITEARAWMWPRFRAGKVSKCPCCGRMVKLYPRTITGGMVRVMAKMANHGRPMSGRDAVAAGKGCGDYAKLVFWGMIKLIPDAGSKQGGWVVTKVGHDFLAGKTHVPKWMLVYDDRVMGCSIKQMTVYEAAGETFSYTRLMDPETVNAAVPP